MFSLSDLIHRLPLTGLVVLVTRLRPDEWDIDSTGAHGPNMVSSEIVTRIQRTTLINAYLSPANTDLNPYLEEALNHFLGKTLSSWGTERGCWIDGESLESTGCKISGIFQDGRPLSSLQATSEVPVK